MCIQKLYDNFKSPIQKYLDDLYGYCAKPNYLATALHTIILLLRIYQLFVYRKSTYYFTSGNRLNICLLCIEKLYDKFKLPSWKYFDDIYGYCAKTNYFATAHHTIIFLMRIFQSFVYCISTNYFANGNRINNCLLCIEKLYDKFKSPIWNYFNDLYG